MERREQERDALWGLTEEESARLEDLSETRLDRQRIIAHVGDRLDLPHDVLHRYLRARDEEETYQYLYARRRLRTRLNRATGNEEDDDGDN